MSEENENAERRVTFETVVPGQIMAIVRISSRWKDRSESRPGGLFL
jgi:hypothetical protein